MDDVATDVVYQVDNYATEYKAPQKLIYQDDLFCS